MRSFNSNDNSKPTDLLQYALSLSQNTSTDNVAIFKGLINDAHRYLLQKYFFNETSFSITTVANQMAYNLPYDYSKLKTGTVTVGTLKWNPTQVLSEKDWENITVFPLYSDIPNNFFIYNGQFKLWPIPSTGSTTATYTALVGTLHTGDTVTVGSVSGTIIAFTSTTMQLAISSGLTLSTGAFTTSAGASGTISANTVTAGNTITFNYQRRVTDLTINDYTTGTVSATQGSYTITGSGTGFLANYLASAGSVLPLNLWIKIASPSGDGNWYQISSIQSATSLTLVNTYQGANTTGATYVIGQMPLLLEDFHDLLVYRPLKIYFSSINPQPEKAKEFSDLYDLGIQSLDSYAGTKGLTVNLRGKINTINANLFPNSIG